MRLQCHFGSSHGFVPTLWKCPRPFPGIPTIFINRPSRNRINSDIPHNSNENNSVPPPVPPSGVIELLAIWAELDEPARRDLLAVARGWMATRR